METEAAVDHHSPRGRNTLRLGSVCKSAHGADTLSRWGGLVGAPIAWAAQNIKHATSPLTYSDTKNAHTNITSLLVEVAEISS